MGWVYSRCYRVECRNCRTATAKFCSYFTYLRSKSLRDRMRMGRMLVHLWRSTKPWISWNIFIGELLLWNSPAEVCCPCERRLLLWLPSRNIWSYSFRIICCEWGPAFRPDLGSATTIARRLQLDPLSFLHPAACSPFTINIALYNIIMRIASIIITLLLSFAWSAFACTDPNCISCVSDPTVCKTCKPGFRASMGKCDPCDEPNCASCNES